MSGQLPQIYTSKKELRAGSRTLLSLAFGLILLISLSIAAIGWVHSHQTYSKLRSIVELLNVKSQLINTMHNAARDRNIALYRMTTHSDPFERNESYTNFKEHGGIFSEARQKLVKLALTEEEKTLLAQQGELAKVGVPEQHRIAELALNNSHADAIKRMNMDILPIQRRMIEILNQLEHIQLKKIQQTAQLAEQKQTEIDYFIIVLSLLLLLVGLYAAKYIIQKITNSEQQVYIEKELAEVTLNSIGDAVITTDTAGLITFMNPVAEELTGWDLENAMNTPLMDVFDIYSETDHKPASNPIELVLKNHGVYVSPHNIILKSADKREFAIEHTASPILDQVRKLHGAIVVFRDVTEMRSLSYKLNYQATHDPLTGLANRREFEHRLEQAIINARNEDQRHALCYMDLDQFKIINDTAGHAAGDELLKQLASKLVVHLRRSDVFARLGGDEFGVLLEGCDKNKAIEIAHGLQRIITEYRFSWGNNAYEIGVSIGIVPIDNMSAGVSKLLGDADTACYEAKEKGRNRIEIYSETDKSLAKRRGEMRWVQDIKTAMQNDKFVTHMQDIIPLQDHGKNMRFCEVLLRIITESGETIPPMAFLPAAERYNMMPDIDRWVVSRALQLLHENNSDAELDNLKLSINISGQSLSEEKFLGYVIDEINNARIDPGKLCFEITETAAIANLSRAVEFITRLKEQGCLFALDDFGSGLSSFSYLKNMPVDYLKIDGSFIRDICSDMMDMAFVEAIHRIGKMMAIETIAEYVEDEETLLKLKELGINYAQGYHISRPGILTDVVSVPSYKLTH